MNKQQKGQTNEDTLHLNSIHGAVQEKGKHDEKIGNTLIEYSFRIKLSIKNRLFDKCPICNNYASFFDPCVLMCKKNAQYCHKCLPACKACPICKTPFNVHRSNPIAMVDTQQSFSESETTLNKIDKITKLKQISTLLFGDSKTMVDDSLLQKFFHYNGMSNQKNFWMVLMKVFWMICVNKI